MDSPTEDEDEDDDETRVLLEVSDTRRLAKIQTEEATQKFEADRALSLFLVKRNLLIIIFIFYELSFQENLLRYYNSQMAIKKGADRKFPLKFLFNNYK